MSNWLFWNIIGLAELLILLGLGYTLYRGVLNKDEERTMRTTRNAVSLFLTFLLLALVSWVVYLVAR